MTPPGASTWISRPPLALTAGILAVIVLLAVAILTPATTGDTRPSIDVALQFWWARVAPRSFAPHALRRANAFWLPASNDYCVHPENPARAWHTIAAQAHAGSLFYDVFASAGSAGRVYALVGLSATGSPHLSEALTLSGTDTATVLFLSDSGATRQEVPFVQLATPDSLRRWAALLLREKCAV